MGNVILTGSCIYCGQIQQIEGQEEILMAAVKHIESGQIDSITIDTGMRVKGKVSKTAKGNIKVERTKTLKTALES